MGNLRMNLRVIRMVTKFRFIEFYRIFNLTAFALRFFAPVMTICITWILYNKVFDGVSDDFRTSTSVDYPTFIIIGNAVFAYMYSTVFILGRVYFHEQTKGTIETFIMTPVSRLSFMLGVLSFAILNATIDFIVILLLGIFIFQLPIHIYHPLVFLVGMVLLISSTFGIGLLVNWITSTMRDRTNTANILTSLFFIFSGIIVPVSMLPVWGVFISSILPLTYVNHLIRQSTVNSIDNGTLIFNIILLMVLTIIFVSLGLRLLRKFESRLKTKGDVSIF